MTKDQAAEAGASAIIEAFMDGVADGSIEPRLLFRFMALTNLCALVVAESVMVKQLSVIAGAQAGADYMQSSPAGNLMVSLVKISEDHDLNLFKEIDAMIVDFAKGAGPIGHLILESKAFVEKAENSI